ncbi:MAG: septation protein IspZ [Planctomycetes bacterium]|nr:septation protein IspZ [Planctomycetota bacterium]
MKFLLEFGPLLTFFLVNAKFGIVPATTAFMVTIVIALGVSWKRERRLPPVPLLTAAFVLVFGGLTIALGDETFIQLKPTVASLFFAVVLLFGLTRQKLYLQTLLGDNMKLEEQGWRILTIRWSLFFVALAIANEYVRHSWTVDQWVTFKTFGILPLTFVFALSQFGVMQRHAIEEEAG